LSGVLVGSTQTRKKQSRKNISLRNEPVPRGTKQGEVDETEKPSRVPHQPPAAQVTPIGIRRGSLGDCKTQARQQQRQVRVHWR
jgi:hypothetical protein